MATFFVLHTVSAAAGACPRKLGALREGVTLWLCGTVRTVRNTQVVLQKQAGVISGDNVPEILATGTGPHPVTILRKPEAHLVATAAGLLSQAQPQRLAPMLCEQIEQSADGRWGKAYDPADVG